MPRTAVKQPRPSDTSVAGAASDFSAKAWMDPVVNGRCDRHILYGAIESTNGPRGTVSSRFPTAASTDVAKWLNLRARLAANRTARVCCWRHAHFER